VGLPKPRPQSRGLRTTLTHKLQFFRFRMPCRRFPQLAAPAKQLLWRQPMASGHGTDRVTARNDFCNNPCLVFAAPPPPTTGAGEDFQPPHRLRDSTMHRVHSKPNGQNQTEDSQISTSSERWPQNTAYDYNAANHRSACRKKASAPLRDYLRRSDPGRHRSLYPDSRTHRALLPADD
jgi:hypothetical protein